MMDEPVAVCAGDVLTGSIVLQRNPVWRRHMSVTLSWSVTSRLDPTAQKVKARLESCTRYCLEPGPHLFFCLVHRQEVGSKCRGNQGCC